MVVSGKVIGYLFLDSLNENHFTKNDATLIETFANSAAVAIENARLFSQEQTQRKQNAVLLELMRLAASSLDLEKVMQTMFPPKVVLNYYPILAYLGLTLSA